ncbi:MAG: hypothetical protein MJY88_03450 [Bacteroidales bacterium]|nr:hypothetical protein [Bacteroidales bacterium]
MSGKGLHFARRVKRNGDNKSWRLSIRHKKRVRLKRKSLLGLSRVQIKSQNLFKRRFADYQAIKAPSYFSLIENPDKVLKFIAQLTAAFNKRRKVFVKLKDLSFISNDALVLLLSNVAQFKAAKIAFNGDRPKNKEIAKIIEESGFYSILYSRKDIGLNNEVTISRDQIITHGKKNVDSELTAKLIHDTSPYLWGKAQRCQGVQRIFIELMQNTNNHASHTAGDKYWWLSSSRKEDPKRLCYAFIDYGMGIFNSLRTKQPGEKFYGWIDKLKSLIDTSKNSNVLKSMLSGEFHKTVTKKYYRGKGLPGIYNEIAKGAITKLIVISNDAYADPLANKYFDLQNKLDGTFVYFEVDSSCKHFNEI